MNRTWMGAAIVAAATTLAGAAVAGTLTVTVPSTANPFLVGYADGGIVTINNIADEAPYDSPVYVEAVTGGAKLAFSNVTGTASYCPGCTMYSASGGWATSSAGGSTVGGFSNFPMSGLVGVFYDASAPQGVVNDSLTTLTPAVNQVFFVGDGSLGTYVVPKGATALFLAVVDGYQWQNNVGAYGVRVSSVPEPATWAMLLAGFAGLGFAAYRRTRGAAAA